MAEEEKVRRHVSFSIPSHDPGKVAELSTGRVSSKYNQNQLFAQEEQTRDEIDERKASSGSGVKSFGEMSLDPRVERAVEKIGWRKPTPVQSAVIPMAIAGKDMLVSAPTGSGKTAAYGIPIAQCLCDWESTLSGVRFVVLVPTRELVQQATAILKSLCRYIDGVRIAAILGSKSVGGNKSKRSSVFKGDSSNFDGTADVLVGTPSSITALCDRNGTNIFETVRFVVVDEADLVLNYGYETDARRALAMIPSSVQAMLLSATLDLDDVEGLGKVVLRNPCTVKIAEESGALDEGSISHYYAKLQSQRDRFLVAYAMLRLNVLCGKVLIFVNSINAGFKLKLFLDQFKLKSAVLNSELPANSRMHCVEQFNAGIFDILIATDEFEGRQTPEVSTAFEVSPTPPEKKELNPREFDEEFGVSRGLDFHNVAAVLNFDVPRNFGTYTHRAGRTARGGSSGTVLTLVVSPDEHSGIIRMGKEFGTPISPLGFRMEQIEAFRYRVEDCLRMITDGAVNSARLVDVQREMVNSEKLKEYFDENPEDLTALQHDLVLSRSAPAHLAHIPSYLLPPALRDNIAQEPDGSRFRVRRKIKKTRAKGRKLVHRNDPLSSFSTSRRKRVK